MPALPDPASASPVLPGLPTQIRLASLRAHADGWETPLPAEVCTALALAGLTCPQAAQLLGISVRRVERWTTARARIPYATWAVLCYRAGFGVIWDQAVLSGGEQDTIQFIDDTEKHVTATTIYTTMDPDTADAATSPSEEMDFKRHQLPDGTRLSEPSTTGNYVDSRGREYRVAPDTAHDD